MNEELSLDNSPSLLDTARQDELIAQHCRGIEGKIRRAASREQAAVIVAETCRSFETACLSEVIQNFLHRHVHNLLEKHWSKRS